MTRATNDVENVAEMFAQGLVALITDVIKMVGFAAVLFALSPLLAGWTFAIVPVLAIAAFFFRLKVREAFREVRVRIARINTYIQESVTGMKVVQLFSREDRNMAEFDAMNADHRNAWHKSIRYDSLLFATIEAATGITMAVILGVGTGLAEVGIMYVFIDYMQRFFMPLRDLSAKYSVMQSAMAGAERIFQVLDTEPVVADPLDAPPPEGDPAKRGLVEFEHVWFSYQDTDGVDEDEVDWILQRRELHRRRRAEGRLRRRDRGRQDDDHQAADPALRRRPRRGAGRRDRRAGAAPAGAAPPGRDGAPGRLPVQRERGAQHRPRSHGRARATRSRRPLARSKPTPSSAACPQGYETEVFERGANFSTGQRQILSFARALAHGAHVLVLDEATSAIDTETEAAIQRGIHVLMEGKTAIAIAHRLSTIRDVDTIHVLKDGRLVESGPHDVLLAQGGHYARLHRLQSENQSGGDGAAKAS